VEKKQLLYEGKAKKIYNTENPEWVIQEFKDDAAVIDPKNRGKIRNKGEINNQISSHLFEYLESFHVPTHFVKSLKTNQMLCKKLNMIRIEVVARNIAAGSLVKRYGLPEGKALDYPILEYYLKDDKLNDPMISEHHAYAFNLATPEEFRTLSRIASKVNAILKSYFERRGLNLVDFKLEFGRSDGHIILGDEISPDTCRLWDIQSKKKLDKNHFKNNLKELEHVYQELFKRVTGEPIHASH
jgi:phosphoribosylaminoimidazole-succinocarboxamide synthase